MAATPKHRRSAQKARSTRASNRYDIVLTRARKMKKNGGSYFHISKETGNAALPHRVSKEKKTYKDIDVIKKK